MAYSQFGIGPNKLDNGPFITKYMLLYMAKSICTPNVSGSPTNQLPQNISVYFTGNKKFQDDNAPVPKVPKLLSLSGVGVWSLK